MTPGDNTPTEPAPLHVNCARDWEWPSEASICTIYQNVVIKVICPRLVQAILSLSTRQAIITAAVVLFT